MSSERQRWLELADSIVDGYDPSTGIYEQFAGFHALEPLLIAKLAPRLPVAADMLLGHERTQAVPGRQAGRRADAALPRPRRGSRRLAGAQPRLLRAAHRPRQHALTGRARHAARPRRPPRGSARDAPPHRPDRPRRHRSHDRRRAAPRRDGQRLAHARASASPACDPAGDALAIDPVLAPGWDTLELRVRFRDSRVRVRVLPGAVEASADPPVRCAQPRRGARAAQTAPPRRSTCPAHRRGGSR